jgi:hypothetical protein
LRIESELLMKTMMFTMIGTLATGCVHYPNLTEVESGGAQVEVYESSRRDVRGVVRATVQERVSTDADGCETVRLRKDYYADSGALQRRVVERRKCGYTVLVLEDRFDDGAHTRRMRVDRDRDGHFEREIVRQDAAPAGLWSRHDTQPSRN